MRVAPLAFAATLLLAACGGKEDAAGNNSSDGEVPPPAAQQQTDTNLTIDAQNMAMPVAMPSPSPLPGLPDDYAGRWAMQAEDCTGGGGQDKGLLTIAGDRLSTGQGAQTVSQVVAASPNRVTATLVDAHNSRRPVALTLLEGGRALLREEQKPFASRRYVRCPA